MHAMENASEVKRPISFHIIRIILVECLGLLTVITAFQKTCPSIVAVDMALSYNVEKHKLGIFAALYFFPYSVFQIISGLLVDYFDPVWVVTVFGIIASLGSVVCGFSKTLFVGIIGRILVGIGTAPTLVGGMKIFRNWFKKSQVPIASGILMCHTCIGGLLGGRPLSLFCSYLGWRNAFYSIGGIGAFFSILLVLIAKGRPEKHGFAPVNEESKPTIEKPAKQRVAQLFANMWKIIKYPYYWITISFVLMNVVPFINATSLWGGQYLIDVLKFNKSNQGIAMMAFHVGVFVGSLVLPQVCKCLKKSKYVLLICGIIESGLLYVLFFLGDKLNYISILSIFSTFGIFTRPNIAIAYPLLHTYYEPELAGTATGIANFFTSLLTAISIQISSKIIAHYGHTDTPSGHVYTWKGYQYGLWLIHCIEATLAILLAIFIKDGDSECCKKKNVLQASLLESTDSTLSASIII